MSNKLKAVITAVLAALVQVVNAVFDIEVPVMVVDALTGILLFLAGLFIKSPVEAEKKS